jgi:hypothetical protein
MGIAGIRSLSPTRKSLPCGASSVYGMGSLFACRENVPTSSTRSRWSSSLSCTLVAWDNRCASRALSGRTWLNRCCGPCTTCDCNNSSLLAEGAPAALWCTGHNAGSNRSCGLNRIHAETNTNSRNAVYKSHVRLAQHRNHVVEPAFQCKAVGSSF